MEGYTNYYQQDQQGLIVDSTDRYPKNHIHFYAFLRLIEWIDTAYSLFGSHGFRLKKALLKEFDSIAPFDEYIGSRDELHEIRKLVELFSQSIDNNPFLSPIGRFLIKKIALKGLKIKNKVLRYYHLNKEYIESHGKVYAPVIITGLPRSGTTLLHRLLSEDPNTRSPYIFEMEVPIPPMTAATNPLEDSRIKDSNSLMAILSRLTP